MENKKRILDYQEFYDRLIEEDLLPSKIDYIWRENNENFMREVLFSFYTTYTRLQEEDYVNPLLKLYSEVMLAAYTAYPEDDGYF